MFKNITAYTNSMESTIKYEGKVGALKLYKELHLIAISLATNSPFKPLSFRKSDQKGVPNLLKGLVPYLTGKPEEKRLALTATQVYKTIYLGPDKSTSSIDQPAAVIEPEFLLEWESFCKKWVQKFRLPKVELEFQWLNTGGKRGPNGPALVSSHLDWLALKENQDLFGIINKWVGPNPPSRWTETLETLNSLERHRHLHTGRLAFLSEGGGKTRVIAVGDYFSQLALRPIHDYLMRWLAKLETDGAHDQQRAALRVKKLANDQSQSFDLSQATDRFPVVLQKILLSHVLGHERAEEWSTLMTKRDFQHPDGRSVRYAVGQPMGLLSSWAAFSITHHALIEYAAYLEGFQSFRDYQVLGDDVVIWNERVGAKYLELLRKIDVPINLTKSLLSQKHHARAEFCKRIFYQGEEISPLNWKVLEFAGKSLYGWPALFETLQNKGWLREGSVFSPPNWMDGKSKQLVQYLALSPLGVSMHPIKGWHEFHLNLEEVKHTYNLKRWTRMRELVAEIRDCMTNYQFVFRRLMPAGEAHTAELLTLMPITSGHPLREVYTQVALSYENVLLTAQGYPSKDGKIPTTLEEVLKNLGELEFIPTPLDRSFIPRDEKEVKVLGRMWLSTVFELTKSANSPTQGG
jgi:hypothetical protein